MKKRRRTPASIEVHVLVDNRHRCCICQISNLPIQIHHIDGNPANSVRGNLAVVCLNCHARVTSDEGLGRRYSAAEVREFKRRWELQCASEPLIEKGNATEDNVAAFIPLYVNLDLARPAGATVGIEIIDNLGPYMLHRLAEALDHAGKLSKVRPEVYEDLELKPDQYILETVAATKVLIPSGILKSTVPGVRELAVWVADPGPETLDRRVERYDFSGTFLYLITTLYDHAQYNTFYSGCSALQVISNLISGKPFLTIDWDEPFGRHNSAHPIEKLKSMGGIVIDRRSIETLYRPRYMSDEQTFTKEGKTHRLHDLLGYPLYIANSMESIAQRARGAQLAAGEAKTEPNSA